MNKDSIRVMIVWLACIIAGYVTLWFTTSRAEKFIDDIPYEDNKVKTNLKIASVVQGIIIGMVQLIRKIRNK